MLTVDPEPFLGVLGFPGKAIHGEPELALVVGSGQMHGFIDCHVLLYEATASELVPIESLPTLFDTLQTRVLQ